MVDMLFWTVVPSSKLTWLWKITMFHRYINYKWPFSIATNYQRVHEGFLKLRSQNILNSHLFVGPGRRHQRTKLGTGSPISNIRVSEDRQILFQTLSIIFHFCSSCWPFVLLGLKFAGSLSTNVTAACLSLWWWKTPEFRRGQPQVPQVWTIFQPQFIGKCYEIEP